MAAYEEKLMNQALALARRGVSAVEPNPAVGCLIEKDGHIMGRGWHKAFGQAHAEINALNDCSRSGAEVNQATLYVTLEPCCHHGKTGPCTEAIIQSGIGKVVVACVDPSVHSSGKGIQRLRDAGIEVVLGVCESQARLLNAPFFKFTRTGRPWVVLKWAQSLDGYLANTPTLGPHQRWISGHAARREVHKLRRRTQAILVGINTVMADDPLLTPRPGKGKNPLRIVLDNTLKIPLHSRLVKTAHRHPLLLVTRPWAASLQVEKTRVLQDKGIEVLALEPAESNVVRLRQELGRRGIQQLLVEGGPRVLLSFLEEDVTDELWIYVNAVLLGSSGSVSLPSALKALTAKIALHHTNVKTFADDVRIQGLLRPISGLDQ